MKTLFINDKGLPFIYKTEVVESRLFTQVPFIEVRNELMWNGVLIKNLGSTHLSRIINLISTRKQQAIYSNISYANWRILLKKEQRFRLLEARYKSFISEFLNEKLCEPKKSTHKTIN